MMRTWSAGHTKQDNVIHYTICDSPDNLEYEKGANKHIGYTSTTYTYTQGRKISVKYPRGIIFQSL